MAEYQRARYHSHRPDRFYPPAVPSGHVGIELEVEAQEGMGYRDLLRLLPDISGERRPVVEEDGSLSSWRGMEIVFPPFSPRQLKHKNGALTRVVESLRGSVVEGANHIGMHYNYSTSGWSRDKKATFCAIIHNLPLGFMRALAARDPEGYDSRVQGRSAAFYASNSRRFCGVRSGRIEVRFFGSTTDTHLMRLRLDFLAVVEAAAASTNWDARMMYEFVASHSRVYDPYVYTYESNSASLAAAKTVAKSVFSDTLASMKGRKWAALRRMWKETT